MPRLLGTVVTAAFSCDITEEDDGRVWYIAGAAIDADGANGQSGQPAAYNASNTGTDFLANAGMALDGSGNVICAKSWAHDCVILGTDNEPKIFAGGVVASKTWYCYPRKALSDPAAYVDAETIPYVVAPPLVIQQTAGVVRGCRARVTYNGVTVDCVVADRGPQDKIGELSIAAARALGLPPSPRDGGTEHQEVTYEMWPGVPAFGFVLQPA